MTVLFTALVYGQVAFGITGLPTCIVLHSLLRWSTDGYIFTSFGRFCSFVGIDRGSKAVHSERGFLICFGLGVKFCLTFLQEQTKASKSKNGEQQKGKTGYPTIKTNQKTKQTNRQTTKPNKQSNKQTDQTNKQTNRSKRAN